MNNSSAIFHLITYKKGDNMKHIKVLKKSNIKDSTKHSGCGECQTSCQSACKTSCTVGNQKCEATESHK